MCLHFLLFLPALLLASSLDDEVKDFRVDELALHLQATQPGAERDYFAGILANREGHTEESIRLLTAALPGIRESSPTRAAVALEALADDYTKSFRYADASRTYDDLLTHFAKQLPPKRLQGTKDDAGVLRLLKDAPAQTVSWQGPVKLKTERNVIDSRTSELTVNGMRAPWLLDTGANLSVVSRSFVHRLGIKPLPGHAQTESGITGLENPLQVALVPTFEIGGATLHNVVVMILDDANLAINLGKETYQIRAILGYPVFQSLGAIKFSRSGEFEAGDSAKSNSGGTPLYMNLLNPVIECDVAGKPLPFTFDTGAQGTNLSVRYFARFHEKDSHCSTAQSVPAVLVARAR